MVLAVALRALPLLHLQALDESLARYEPFIDNGIAVAAPDDLVEVLEDARPDQKVYRLVEHGLLDVVRLQVDRLVAQLLHYHLDRVCFVGVVRGLGGEFVACFVVVGGVSLALGDLVLGGVGLAVLATRMLCLEVADVDRRPMLYELIVNVHNVPQLDRADGIRELHGLLDGALDQNLVEAGQLLLRLVLSELAHDLLPPAGSPVAIDIGALHEALEAVEGGAGEWQLASDEE